MNTRNLTRSSMIAVLAGLLVAGLNVQGQTLRQKLADGIAANKRKLQQYTYLQETEVYVGGRLRNTRVARVHYDPVTGAKVSVPLDSGNAERPQGRRLRARIIRKRRNEMKAYIQRLLRLMREYLPPAPSAIKLAMPRARITPAAGRDFRVTFNSYVKPGDRVIFRINRTTRKLDQISIRSRMDGDPVSFDVVFARLADGTNYPSVTSIKSGAKNLEVRVIASDYRK